MPKVFPHLVQFPAGSGAVGKLDALGKLIESQPSAEQMAAQGKDRLLPLGIGRTARQLVQLRHANTGGWPAIAGKGAIDKARPA